MQRDKRNIFSKKTFDATSFKVEVKNTTISTLTEMLHNEIIVLDPAFQRNKDLWSPAKQSELIESVLLGLPLPSFYFYNDTRSKRWIIIDGLQRLCSINNFMVKETLKLQDLSILDSYNGCKFSGFSFYDQTTVRMFPITINVITGNVSPEAITLIFKRVNAKGTPLTDTEIRNALYQGKSTELIKRMVSLPIFKRLVSDNISTDRMADREYATRFLAFYLDKELIYYSGNMDDYLCSTMEYVNSLPESDINGILHSFEKSMMLCEDILGCDAFRIPKRSSDKKKHPVSRALFETLTVSFSDMDSQISNRLVCDKDKFLREYTKMCDSAEIKNALVSNTASVRNVNNRYKALTELISKYRR